MHKASAQQAERKARKGKKGEIVSRPLEYSLATRRRSGKGLILRASERGQDLISLRALDFPAAWPSKDVSCRGINPAALRDESPVDSFRPRFHRALIAASRVRLPNGRETPAWSLFSFALCDLCGFSESSSEREPVILPPFSFQATRRE
jgi:hypothetical protein